MKPRIRTDRVRRVVLLLLLGITLVVAGVWYLTRPARLNRVVTQMLEKSIGCRAFIGPTHLSLGGVLSVDGVDLMIPGETGESARLFKAQRATVGLRLWPLLIGRVRASSVSVQSPTLYLTENLDDGRFNYEKLLASLPSRDDRVVLPTALAELYISRGEVKFGRVVGGVYEPTDSLSLEGTLTADSDELGVYRFVLSQRSEDGVGDESTRGPLLQGTIDLAQPMIQLQVDRFAFTGPQRYLLPSAARQWWDRLSPRGDLPRVVFSARLDEQQEVILSAQMRLEGIGLTLPLPESVTPQPLRLTGVSGSVRFEDGGVTFDDLRGEVEGIAFTAEGRVDGFQAGAPFSLSVSTQPFDVPAEGGLWDKMPPSVLKYHHRFSPHGRYQGKVTIKKTGPDAALTFNGYIDLLDTRFAYDKFPYPAKSLTGRISFDQQRIVLNDLVGLGPSGGRTVVSGTIEPPGKDAAVDITIRGAGMPVDHYLTDAMKLKHRKVIEMFFDQAGYDELVERGVIRPLGSEPNDGVTGQPQQAPAPVGFDLGGAASMVVRIQRPRGAGQRYRVTTDLDVSGLRALFSFWHYPVYAQEGRILITPEHVQITGVRLRGVGGGGGVVDGRLELPGDGRALAPALQLTEVWLPIDRALVASIPSPKDQWVSELNLTGVLAGTGEIYATADGQVAFTLDGQIQNGTATPHGGDFTLTSVHGGVTIERTRVQLEGLTGQHGSGSITLDGVADFGGQGVGVDLRVTGDDLTVERGLIHLLSSEHEARPRLFELFDTYQPDGRFNAQLHYQGGDGQRDRYTLNVWPRGFAFDFNAQRIELTGLTGRVTLTPQKAQLHSVAGGYDAGTFEVDGDIRFGDDSGIDLIVDVDAVRIDLAARALLPKAVLSLIDGLSLQGPYRLEHARVLTRPWVKQGPQTIFEGKVKLLGAQAHMGVPITELTGTLDMHMVKFADHDWAHIDIRIDADYLRAADRLVERVSMTVVTGEQPWLIEMQNLKGAVYGGTLIGHGQIELGDPGVFSFDMTIQEVEFEPFLHPLEVAVLTDTPTPDTAPLPQMDDPDGSGHHRADLPMRNMASGLLSASLMIRAPLDDPTQCQGRGVVMIRDAKLYEKPLSLALLQAVNLALPTEQSFDRASARYLVYGNTVRFDDIRLEAPQFVIAGTGTMDYSSTRLDLKMVTYNPAAPDLGAVTDLVRTFKDELLGIEVRGTLIEPKARVVTLKGFFKSWGRIFGDHSARITHDQPAELQPGTP